MYAKDKIKQKSQHAISDFTGMPSFCWALLHKQGITEVKHIIATPKRIGVTILVGLKE